jgi:type II secretion system protein N
MLKKLLVGIALLILVAVLGLWFFARAVLGHEAVRTALATQASNAIGQPVVIGGISAAIFPRVTVNLQDVAIGAPPRIQVRSLQVGADLGALFSRRIERARLRLAGARIELPLPPLTAESGDPAADEPPDNPPVELVSIDEIVLSEVEVVSGGHTLRGDIELVPERQGLALRRLTLGAGDTRIEASGHIRDLFAPAGELSLKAGALDVDQLLALATAFSSGAGLPATEPRGGAAARVPSGSSAMNLSITIEADRATMGGMTIDTLTGGAKVTADAITIEPMAFNLFGGRYEGALSLNLAGAAPTFRWRAALAGIDVAAASAFAGRPDTISGRLSGKLDLVGEGNDAAAATQTLRGTTRLEVTNGVVRNLGLVRTIVAATSSLADAKREASGPRDEAFSRLAATLVIADGAARTDDFLFESADLSLTASGTLRLDGSAINLAGKVQLSEELTKKAGNDLVRYTQDQGRVTLPATITGSASAPSVRIDVADAARRAIRNRATEETQKAIKKGIGGLFKRP